MHAAVNPSHVHRRRARASALLLCLAGVWLIAGCGNGDARSSGARSELDRGAQMLARCRPGPATSATDQQGDTVTQRELTPFGRPRRPSTGASIEPFTTAPQPWLDLIRVTVKVRRGLLCVTIRVAGRAPRKADPEYALRVAPIDQPAAPNILLIGNGVQWLPDGNAQSDEAQVPHGYRLRGSTISVAVRLDDLVTSVPLALGERFRWRMRSTSDPMLKRDSIYSKVDCAPHDEWITYPQGQPIAPLGDEFSQLRCPA